MKKIFRELLTERGRIRSLTKYVVFSISVILIYTAIAIIYQILSGEELSSTLTTCFFSAFAGEILLSAFIKIFKIKRESTFDYLSNNVSESFKDEDCFDRE